MAKSLDGRKTNVLDGNYWMYRAYHASFKADLRTSKGHPSGALKFFHNMLLPLLREQDNLIVVFDSSKKNFRHTMFPEYKANRKPTPPDLILQKSDIRELCLAYGLPVIIRAGVEADDVLGTLARVFTERGQRLTIQTGDKDCAQFLSEFVDLYDSKIQKRTTVKSLLKEKGLTPKQVTYFLALTGDKVDNIPGVAGVGPGTALKWLNEYGTLKNLVKHQKDIKGKIGEKLRASIDDLRLSFALVKCKTDVDINLDKLIRGKQDVTVVKQILKRYEIRN